MSEAKRLDQALESIDSGRRDALRKIVTATAFVAPVVASFAVDGMVVSAHAASCNSTCS